MSQKIDINKLSTDEVAQLVCSRIYCDTIDPNVLKIFEEKTNGNPFFVHEIIQVRNGLGLR